MQKANGSQQIAPCVVYSMIYLLSLEQIYCPVDDTWPQTPALTTAYISCGIGFFGEQTRFCSATGEWETPSASNCVAKQLCPAVEEWEAVYEGDTYTLSCDPGYTGSISRLCALGGTWTDPVDNCSRRMSEI